MSESQNSKRVVVYMVQRHPLETTEDGQFFRWLNFDEDLRDQLEGIIGQYDRSKLTLLVDNEPAGEAWDQLLDDLIHERIHSLVTHLAPLSAVQRHQLIGLCAEVGTQLITPSDAGRNRLSDQNEPPE
jgi:hypothetical protein